MNSAVGDGFFFLSVEFYLFSLSVDLTYFLELFRIRQY